MMIRRDFKKSSKIMIFSNLGNFESKLPRFEKIIIFDDSLKSLPIIINHHSRYLEIFLGFKEHVFEIYSKF